MPDRSMSSARMSTVSYGTSMRFRICAGGVSADRALPQRRRPSHLHHGVAEAALREVLVALDERDHLVLRNERVHRLLELGRHRCGTTEEGERAGRRARVLSAARCTQLRRPGHRQGPELAHEAGGGQRAPQHAVCLRGTLGRSAALCGCLDVRCGRQRACMAQSGEQRPLGTQVDRRRGTEPVALHPLCPSARRRYRSLAAQIAPLARPRPSAVIQSAQTNRTARNSPWCASQPTPPACSCLRRPCLRARVIQPRAAEARSAAPSRPPARCWRWWGPPGSAEATPRATAACQLGSGRS